MGLDERSKGDYQPWNHEEFMADRKVRRMRSAVRKTYAMLLHEMFFCTTRPYLPDDDTELFLLGDCDTLEEWQAMRPEIIGMFEMIEQDGVHLLRHSRVEDDWHRILKKRGSISSARSEAAKARWNKREQPDANAMQTDANDAKEVSKKESKVSEESDPENGQEIDVKARKQIEMICKRTLGVTAEQFPTVWSEVRDWELAESSGWLVREFEQWAAENVGDEFRGKPVSVFLRSLTNPERALQKTAAADSTVVDLVRELVYLTDGAVAFDNKQKAGIAQLIQDGNTPAEITAAFKEYKAKLNFEDQFQMKFAAKTFVETADQLVYTARRKKAEKETEACAVDAARERMEREAAEERERRAAVRKLDEESVEETLTAD